MNEFEEAEIYNEKTRHQLNEKQQFYADGLLKDGFEVRFSNKRILNRMGEGGIIITVLRSNLTRVGEV